MKRIIILIDGTWNEEGTGDDTNIAKLDPNYGSTGAPLIKPIAADKTVQQAFYHKGVGSDPDLLKHLLGGAIGCGLKQIVRDAYQAIVKTYVHGDEIYILGFSRGAYAARALAGLIGASGIRRSADTRGFDVVWQHYRVDPAIRAGEKPASSGDQKAIDSFGKMTAENAIHPDRRIKCVGVFDTVGSYGVPAGIGLAPLARYVTLALLGFTTPVLVPTSMSACMRLPSMNGAVPSSRPSGRHKRAIRHGGTSSRPGLRASIPTSAAAVPTPASRIWRWSG